MHSLLSNKVEDWIPIPMKEDFYSNSLTVQWLCCPGIGFQLVMVAPVDRVGLTGHILDFLDKSAYYNNKR